MFLFSLLLSLLLSLEQSTHKLILLIYTVYFFLKKRRKFKENRKKELQYRCSANEGIEKERKKINKVSYKLSVSLIVRGQKISINQKERKKERKSKYNAIIDIHSTFIRPSPHVITEKDSDNNNTNISIIRTGR